MHEVLSVTGFFVGAPKWAYDMFSNNVYYVKLQFELHSLSERVVISFPHLPAA